MPNAPPPAETGTYVWNTALLIGWDEPGGTSDHVPPGPVPPPDPAAPAGEFGFTFNRSGYRVPAIMVSPWVEPGSVYNEEYRHTSLIATLRKTWGLGEAFTGRDASARTFDHVFSELRRARLLRVELQARAHRVQGGGELRGASSSATPARRTLSLSNHTHIDTPSPFSCLSAHTAPPPSDPGGHAFAPG